MGDGRNGHGLVKTMSVVKPADVREQMYTPQGGEREKGILSAQQLQSQDVTHKTPSLESDDIRRYLSCQQHPGMHQWFSAPIG